MGKSALLTEICHLWQNLNVGTKRSSATARFGDLLRVRRKTQGLTLSELSAASGINNGNLSRIERGERMPPKLPLLVGLLDALKIQKNSTLWNQFLGAAARDRLEPIDVAGVTYLSRENALHGLSDSKEKGPQEMSLIEAASEIGKLSVSCGIKKITVTASDGSEYFFYIREQE